MTAQNRILINNYFWAKAAQSTQHCRAWLRHTIKT